MGTYADIYVIKKTRSRQVALDFLDHFLPERAETTDAYEVPRFADDPIVVFSTVEELMEYAAQHPTVHHGVYLRNTDEADLKHYAMLFYTNDGYTIFGISWHKEDEDEDPTGEKRILQELKDFLEAEEGYITYENPPPDTYPEFMELVEEYRHNLEG